MAHQHHEHHDHDHEEAQIIHLTLEDNSEIECIVVADFEVEGKTYMALLPENQEKVLVYQYKENQGELELLLIEDDQEFDLVSKTYNSMLEEELEKED